MTDGYVATTIEGIATEAGVSAKTVYDAFATKPGVLRGVWDLALKGDTDDAPVEARPWFVQVLEEPDPARMVKLIARNYRCKMGEIDLVMLDGATLVLTEVRYRASTDYGGAAASVDWRKQRRLVNAAEHLLMKRAELKRYPARFDVIAITATAAGAAEPQIDWIKRAFTL